jgi:hypothetical protein
MNGGSPLTNQIILTILSAGLAFLAARYWFERNAAVAAAKVIAEEHQRTLDRLADLEYRLKLIDGVVVPISTAMQQMLIRELTHFHEPETDALLVKLGPPNRLTEIEESRLAVLLKAREVDMGPLISDSERDAALILPAIIKRARAESEVLATAEALRLRLITVAAVLAAPNAEEPK